MRPCCLPYMVNIAKSARRAKISNSRVTFQNNKSLTYAGYILIPNANEFPKGINHRLLFNTLVTATEVIKF